MLTLLAPPLWNLVPVPGYNGVHLVPVVGGRDAHFGRFTMPCQLLRRDCLPRAQFDLRIRTRRCRLYHEWPWFGELHLYLTHLLNHLRLLVSTFNNFYFVTPLLEFFYALDQQVLHSVTRGARCLHHLNSLLYHHRGSCGSHRSKFLQIFDGSCIQPFFIK